MFRETLPDNFDSDANKKFKFVDVGYFRDKTELNRGPLVGRWAWFWWAYVGGWTRTSETFCFLLALFLKSRNDRPVIFWDLATGLRVKSHVLNVLKSDKYAKSFEEHPHKWQYILHLKKTQSFPWCDSAFDNQIDGVHGRLHDVWIDWFIV